MGIPNRYTHFLYHFIDKKEECAMILIVAILHRKMIQKEVSYEKKGVFTFG